ncbi:hypothetical protein D6825_03500 [Candidatus Woesearchaeota archaeon]|nr:MAG: hypothetical protein D6825_03500 [Candidatus Woesearchaeota archaeon]
MLSVYLHRPQWFLGVDASLELLAAIITLAVTIAAFRLWRVVKTQKYATFTASFALLSAAFFVRSITDTILEGILLKVSNEIGAKIFLTGYITHIVLSLTAYLLLIGVTLKIKDMRVLSLIGFILVPGLFLSSSYYTSFYGLSLIMLAYITQAYWKNYKKCHRSSACLVFTAFFLLTTAQAAFLLEPYNEIWYVAAHLSQMLGFVSLLAALIKTLMK